MKIGVLAAPVVAGPASLVATWDSASGVIPAASVLLGYLAGLLAARYDIGIIKETKE